MYVLPDTTYQHITTSSKYLLLRHQTHAHFCPFIGDYDDVIVIIVIMMIMMIMIMVITMMMMMMVMVMMCRCPGRPTAWTAAPLCSSMCRPCWPPCRSSPWRTRVSRPAARAAWTGTSTPRCSLPVM